VQDYFIKPFDIDDLLNGIKRVLDKHILRGFLDMADVPLRFYNHDLECIYQNQLPFDLQQNTQVTYIAGCGYISYQNPFLPVSVQLADMLPLNDPIPAVTGDPLQLKQIVNYILQHGTIKLYAEAGCVVLEVTGIVAEDSLPILRYIVEAHGGHLTIDSQTLIIKLPEQKNGV
jgi:signal transduction histidine kinase